MPRFSCLVTGCFWLLMSLWPGVAPGALTVILSRHAEKAAVSGNDPPLSAAGQQRAAKLAAMLADAGVDAIYVSEFLRTRQTAQPLAKRLGVTPEVSRAADTAGLIRKLRQRSRGTVLVVGHSDTAPAIISGLGGPQVSIGVNDYENIFVVTIESGSASYLKFRYGESIPKSVSKELRVELDFRRSGGFAGMATQVEGKLQLEGTSGLVSNAAGYSRKLSADEATKLAAMASAALRQKGTASAPGELRDGYQYDVTVAGADGSKQQLVTHGEADVTGVFSWVRAECEKIWKFRTGG